MTYKLRNFKSPDWSHYHTIMMTTFRHGIKSYYTKPRIHPHMVDPNILLEEIKNSPNWFVAWFLNWVQ